MSPYRLFWLLEAIFSSWINGSFFLKSLSVKGQTVTPQLHPPHGSQQVTDSKEDAFKGTVARKDPCCAIYLSCCILSCVGFEVDQNLH